VLKILLRGRWRHSGEFLSQPNHTDGLENIIRDVEYEVLENCCELQAVEQNPRLQMDGMTSLIFDSM
jgi:hypothetical protein